MLTIDHTTHDQPTSRARSVPAPSPVVTAACFAAAQVPLATIAIACRWPETDTTGSIAADVILFGSPISGPIGAQAIVIALAALASRRARTPRTIGTACLAVMGVLIAFNGSASALGEPQWAPKLVAVTGGIAFVLAGAMLTTTSVRALLAGARRRECGGQASTARS